MLRIFLRRRMLGFLLSWLTPLVSLAQYPGLYEPDGFPHELPAPNPVTGVTLNVLDYGADPTDSDHDDLPAVRAALTDAQPGDEVYFPPGIYNFLSTSPRNSRSHLLLKSGVNLRGAGPDSSILKSGFGDKTIENFLLLQGLRDVVISDLGFTAAFTGSYSRDWEHNNPDAGGPRYVIRLEDSYGTPCSNVVIERVKIENFRSHGVRIHNSREVVVRDSHFENATDVGPGGSGYGVCIMGNGEIDNESKFNLVEDCTFLGPYLRHGVLLQYATHNNLVQRNYFDSIILDAIDLHGEDEYLNEIRENEVYNVRTGAGVGVGNTGSTHDASGPYNYIHHNKMVNCREGVKVYLGSPDTRIEYNEVTGSEVTGGKGIYLLNAPRTLVKGNHIHDNPGGGFTGIRLNYDPGTNGRGKGVPRDIRLVENRIYHNDYGIRIYAGEGIVLENNEVHDNFVQDFYSSVPVEYHLRLAVDVQGRGTVLLDPPGGSYPEGTVVRLLAQRGPNHRFDHWEGDLSGSANPESLLIDDNKHVVAVFRLDPSLDEVKIAARTVGNGRVEFDPPGGIYPRGTRVAVRAVAEHGWRFDHWGRGLAGASPIDTLTLVQDTLVVAYFEPLPKVNLLVWINGRGRVELSPPGGVYTLGDTVILRAVPDSGYQFAGWAGDLTGTENPDTLVLDSDKAVIARFAPATGVESETSLPREIALYPNYPNPFNAGTTIRFALPRPSQVRISVYDARGRLVAVLLEGQLEAGLHRVHFDASELPSGIYFYQLEAGSWKRARKMLLVK